MICDVRIVECPGCDGAGHVFYSVWEWEDNSRPCPYCDGKGEIEDECQLITLDELDEIPIHRAAP